MPSRLTARTAAAGIAAAAFLGAAVAGTATAGALTPQDEQFAKFVTELGIPMESPEQAVRFGNNICTLLTSGGASGPNPVPVIRGVVNTLTNTGMDKSQAVPAMRAAVTVYCPEYARLIGR